MNDDGEIIEFVTKPIEDTKEDAVETSDSESSAVKPTSLQQKMVALSGQNVDEFMKEMETVQKKIEPTKEDEIKTKLSAHIEPIVPQSKLIAITPCNKFDSK